MSRLRKVALGSAVTAVVGSGAAAALYRKRLRENKELSAKAYNASQDAEQMLSVFDWVRQVSCKSSASAGAGGPGVEFFRYTTCPYCGKVKAFLDYYRIPYQAVEVEPMFKSQIADSNYKKVPQLRFGGRDGAYLVDSSEIVDTLASYVGAGVELGDADVQHWREWARESLVRLIVVNINKTLVQAWEGYSYIDNFDSIPLANKVFLKVIGAPVMYLVSEYKTRPSLAKAGHLQAHDDVRAALHRHVAQYVDELRLSEQRPFHGGSKPDLADLDVYGVFQSVRGHAVYDDLLLSTNIGPWMARMDRETGQAQYTLRGQVSAIE